jgi:hypothetical protein
MSELLEIQNDIAASLHDATASTRAERRLRGEVDLIQKRLAIYRANTNASIAKALVAAYPVIQRVVGDEFFDALARACHRALPSVSGDLFDYGADFAEFLEQLPHTRSMPYLPDLARVEWAVHRAYGAADATAWDASSLAEVPEAHQAAISFEWAAGTSLIASDYPLARIWMIHQDDYEGEFDVDWSTAQRVLVARDGFRVAVSALSEGDAAFVAASLAGRSLGSAATDALNVDATFDLGALLSKSLASHLITGFTLKDE